MLLANHSLGHPDGFIPYYGRKGDRHLCALKRLAKAFRTEILFFEADDLSMKIIEYYQRYLIRKG